VLRRFEGKWWSLKGKDKSGLLDRIVKREGRGKNSYEGKKEGGVADDKDVRGGWMME
jgi:hypothetical protein